MSLEPVCRIGDVGSHGGAVATGSPSLSADGIAVARTSDIYDCAIHGPQALIGSAIISAEGLAVVRIGDLAACGSVMTAGSPTMNSQ